MKNKIIACLLCGFLCFASFAFTDLQSVSAQSPDFGIDISAPKTIFTDTRITITVTLTEISAPISGIDFVLLFDSNYLTPVITQNTNDEMDAFIKSSPANSWEQLCRYNESESSYNLRFSAPDGAKDENTLVKTDNELIIEIPFDVTQIGDTSIFIPEKDIIGVDNNLGLISGSGTDKTFTIYKSEKIMLIPESKLTQYNFKDAKYISGISENTPVSDFLKEFSNTNIKIIDYKGNSITDGICKTGFIINLYAEDTLLDSTTLVVKGDINRDGKINSVDYLFVKRAFLGTVELDNTQLQAAYIKENKITAMTYLMIKRHVLGTYNIYG